MHAARGILENTLVSRSSIVVEDDVLIKSLDLGGSRREPTGGTLSRSIVSHD